jgi:hypothetical protein
LGWKLSGALLAEFGVGRIIGTAFRAFERHEPPLKLPKKDNKDEEQSQLHASAAADYIILATTLDMTNSLFLPSFFLINVLRNG